MVWQGEVSLCLASNLAYKTLSLPPPAPRGVGDEYMKGLGLVPLLLKHNTPVPPLSRIIVMTKSC